MERSDASDVTSTQNTKPGSSQRKFPRLVTTVQRLEAHIKSWLARIHSYLHKNSFHGWRMGVLFGSIASGLVLCCNIALLVVGYTRSGGFDESGIADLMRGSERTISRWNTVLHLFINMLSSVLLASSNYTMQVLSSPTRSELDRAHARGESLDIGILSSRNLTSVNKRRALLCAMLGLSSLPLHLL